MGENGNRLMDRFKAAVRAADGLDGVGPNVGGFIRLQLDGQFQPLVHQPEFPDADQVLTGVELAELLPLYIVKIAICAAAGHSGKVHLDGKAEGYVGRQLLKPIMHFVTAVVFRRKKRERFCDLNPVFRAVGRGGESLGLKRQFTVAAGLT